MKLTRELIDNLPTVARDAIKEYLESMVKKVEAEKVDNAINYTLTADEKYRGVSLEASGKHIAFSALYEIFK